MGREQDFEENAGAIGTPFGGDDDAGGSEDSGGTGGSGGSGEGEPYPHPPGDLNKKTPVPGPQ